MSFQEQYDITQTPKFKECLQVAMRKYALSIVGIDGNKKAEKRHQLSMEVLINGDNWIDRFSFAVAGCGKLTPKTWTDDDLENAVNEIWDGLAGVKDGDGI